MVQKQNQQSLKPGIRAKAQLNSYWKRLNPLYYFNYRFENTKKMLKKTHRFYFKA